MPRLRTLLGNHAHLNPLKSGAVISRHLAPDFADEPQPHEAFKIRMLRASKEQAAVKPANWVDMVPFGIEETRRSLELVVRLAHEQQVISRRIAVDELFADIRGLL